MDSRLKSLIRECKRPPAKAKRRPYQLSSDARRAIFVKTAGRCHVCGCELVFENYGGKKCVKHSDVGRWQLDHIHAARSGGGNDHSNFLPICTHCNHARWFDTDLLPLYIELGRLARNHILKQDALGKMLADYVLSARKARNAR